MAIVRACQASLTGAHVEKIRGEKRMVARSNAVVGPAALPGPTLRKPGRPVTCDELVDLLQSLRRLLDVMIASRFERAIHAAADPINGVRQT